MVQLAPPSLHSREVFADPTPMGLLGLAIGCAALTPIAFGTSVTSAALETVAVLCLLFGAGCQFLSGLLNLVNRNLYGGTLFLTFAFNWVFNWWVLHTLSHGVVPDSAVTFAIEVAFLVIFVLISWGFGHFSSLLFVFLLDIDLLYGCKVAGHLLHSRAFDLPVALLTVLLGVLSLWIAFALLLNPVTGRRVFPLGGPVFRSQARAPLELVTRAGLVGLLYQSWRDDAEQPPALADVLARLGAVPAARVRAEIAFLAAHGIVARAAGDTITLTPAGIDLWERHLCA